MLTIQQFTRIFGESIIRPRPRTKPFSLLYIQALPPEADNQIKIFFGRQWVLAMTANVIGSISGRSAVRKTDEKGRREVLRRRIRYGKMTNKAVANECTINNERPVDSGRSDFEIKLPLV